MESSPDRPGIPTGTPDRRRSREISGAHGFRRSRDAGHASRLAVRSTVDRVHRSGKRLGVALHFGCEFADLGRVLEMSALVRDDANRDSHEWHTVQLAASVLAEEIAGATILLGVLIRDEQVEYV